MALLFLRAAQPSTRPRSRYAPCLPSHSSPAVALPHLSGASSSLRRVRVGLHRRCRTNPPPPRALCRASQDIPRLLITGAVPTALLVSFWKEAAAALALHQCRRKLGKPSLFCRAPCNRHRFPIILFGSGEISISSTLSPCHR